MSLKIEFTSKDTIQYDLLIISSYSKNDTLDIKHWPKDKIELFNKLNSSNQFKAKRDTTFSFNDENGKIFLTQGLGHKKGITIDVLRDAISVAIKEALKFKIKTVLINIDSFKATSNIQGSLQVIIESILLTTFKYDKYKSTKKDDTLEKIYFFSKSPSNRNHFIKAYKIAFNIAESVNLCRELVNEVPNMQNSESLSTLIEKDARQITPKVKIKILKKQDLIKEKLNLILAVNLGSSYDPRLIHLEYNPSKKNSKTKHILLIGKGITFDTGGYNLKPSSSIANMKTDMGGAATVYSAFKAAVLNKSPHKITCLIPITDNALNDKAIKPDSIIKTRSGKTVEILNTDAEGRLILADAIDYGSDLKPDFIIDVATLTGACLVSFGTEVCAIVGNNKNLTKSLKESAKKENEYLWELPIIPEWRKDIKSKIADIKNIGSSRWAGTSKGAAFIQEFLKNDIPWAHLDIAGVVSDQSHLPYCPSKGGTGAMVRSLINFLSKKI